MSPKQSAAERVIEKFGILRECLLDLRVSMLEVDQHLPAWFQAPPSLPLPPHWNEREQAFALISQLEYLEDQAPREILVGAGLIAASEGTLSALDQLNQAKDDFKSTMLQIKNADKASLKDIHLNDALESLMGRTQTTQDVLRRHGLARLHLKQCYRRLPVFDRRPLKVSWTWANTRAITRLDVGEARELLKKQGRDRGIEAQLRRLEELDPTEPLAIVQELAPHLRANIILPIPERKQIERLMVKGPIPIFYLQKDNLGLPVFKAPGEKKSRDKNRGVRSDVKLDPEPFLPAIHVHRYLVKS